MCEYFIGFVTADEITVNFHFKLFIASINKYNFFSILTAHTITWLTLLFLAFSVVNL
jgi:hypothetical protein